MFGAVCLVGLTATWVSLSRGTAGPPTNGPPAPNQSAPGTGLTGGSYLLFRSTLLNRAYGLVGLLPTGDPGGTPIVSAMRCDRVDFAGARGICLARPPRGALTLTNTTATVFDDRFRTLATVQLGGYPSRVRVSPDGALASVTNFVSGDSYATMGAFSTRTDIIDLNAGKVVFGLEKLAVTRDGEPFQGVDFNFWGVTFAADNRRFYATLGTGGRAYLVQGDVVTRQARVVRADVECPSLSPDNRFLAFKKRLPGAVVSWQLSVLDLATMTETPLAETRNVDDQPGWLDDSTVIYGLAKDGSDTAGGRVVGPTALTRGASIATDTWKVPADGTGAPTLLVAGSWSTVVAPR